MPSKPDNDSPEWNEFEWERALRESDEYARKYFQLIQRFSDLPGANELIATHMGEDPEDIPFDSDECEFCENRWACELENIDQWEFSEDWDEDGPDEDDDTKDPQPGDAYFYEADGRFKMLRQIALGWCNIYAAVLPAESRRTALNIMFHIGRSLGNLGYSIGDGLYDQPAASIAFGKRALRHINDALGLMDELVQERPPLNPLLSAMKTHLLKAHDALVDFVQQLRAIDSNRQ